MFNQTIKAGDKSMSESASKSIAEATEVMHQLRDNLGETASSAVAAMKEEAKTISNATREVVASVGVEISKHPLTYTLAAAGVGALTGVALVALLNRPKTVLLSPANGK